MKNEKHNNLFCLCENCSHPIIISKQLEISLLPKTRVIQCPYCQYENVDLEGLKDYAKHSREFASN